MHGMVALLIGLMATEQVALKEIKGGAMKLVPRLQGVAAWRRVKKIRVACHGSQQLRSLHACVPCITCDSCVAFARCYQPL